jgi:glycosyltransferase involved in cell wall biosynthesis
MNQPPQPADAPRRPHLLYVAWGFPPSRAGAVYRALATANAFAAGGWDVTVLTVEREVFEKFTGSDPSLEALVDPSITVERVPFEWPALETDLRKWPRERVYAPALWRKRQSRRDQEHFPEPSYGSWRPVIEQAARRIHHARPVDLTLSTANPNVTFTAAWYLYETYGVDFVMDYRDAWTLDVFDGHTVHQPDSEVGGWERRLLDAAREVWFVNEPIAAWHREHYPQDAAKMHVVMNGWDADLAPDHTPEVPAAGEPLVFGYIGTVSPKVPLAEFIEGWRLARRGNDDLVGAEAHIHGYLGFYQTPRPELVTLVDDAAPDGVRYLGPVGKTDVHRTYEGFHACLLILGAGTYVTSGKVFEYLATGMPIVSVHDPGNAATSVLEGYPLWFPVRSLEPDDIAAALRDAAHAARTASIETRLACREFGERFSRDHQLHPRVDALLESTTEAAR